LKKSRDVNGQVPKDIQNVEQSELNCYKDLDDELNKRNISNKNKRETSLKKLDIKTAIQVAVEPDKKLKDIKNSELKKLENKSRKLKEVLEKLNKKLKNYRNFWDRIPIIRNKSRRSNIETYKKAIETYKKTLENLESEIIKKELELEDLKLSTII
jgi:chromosome segregation ATPase